MTATSSEKSSQHQQAMQQLKAGLVVLSKTKAGCFAHARGQEPQQGHTLPDGIFTRLLQSGTIAREAGGSYAYMQQPAPLAVTVNDRESPLYRLFQRPDGAGKRYLSEHQFQAGERLRVDFERSQLSQRVTSSWSGERVDQSSHATLSDNRLAHLTDTALDARQRLHNAFDAVGPELAAVLYYVCCLASGLEQAERFLELPPRSGKAILALALTRLARHYRLLQVPASSSKSRDIGHWALADFRPPALRRESRRRLSLDARHHRGKTVGALLGQMVAETQSLEHLASIKLHDVLHRPAGEHHEDDGNQALDDERVTIASEGHDGVAIALCGSGVDPHLALHNLKPCGQHSGSARQKVAGRGQAQ